MKNSFLTMLSIALLMLLNVNAFSQKDFTRIYRKGETTGKMLAPFKRDGVTDKINIDDFKDAVSKAALGDFVQWYKLIDFEFKDFVNLVAMNLNEGKPHSVDYGQTIDMLLHSELYNRQVGGNEKIFGRLPQSKTTSDYYRFGSIFSGDVLGFPFQDQDGTWKHVDELIWGCFNPKEAVVSNKDMQVVFKPQYQTVYQDTGHIEYVIQKEYVEVPGPTVYQSVPQQTYQEPYYQTPSYQQPYYPQYYPQQSCCMQQYFPQQCGSCYQQQCAPPVVSQPVVQQSNVQTVSISNVNNVSATTTVGIIITPPAVTPPVIDQGHPEPGTPDNGGPVPGTPATTTADNGTPDSGSPNGNGNGGTPDGGGPNAGEPKMAPAKAPTTRAQSPDDKPYNSNAGALTARKQTDDTYQGQQLHAKAQGDRASATRTDGSQLSHTDMLRADQAVKSFEQKNGYKPAQVHVDEQGVRMSGRADAMGSQVTDTRGTSKPVDFNTFRNSNSIGQQASIARNNDSRNAQQLRQNEQPQTSNRNPDRVSQERQSMQPQQRNQEPMRQQARQDVQPQRQQYDRQAAQIRQQPVRQLPQQIQQPMRQASMMPAQRSASMPSSGGSSHGGFAGGRH